LVLGFLVIGECLDYSNFNIKIATDSLIILYIIMLISKNKI